LATLALLIIHASLAKEVVAMSQVALGVLVEGIPLSDLLGEIVSRMADNDVTE
jgi:hypothetical protein